MVWCIRDIALTLQCSPAPSRSYSVTRAASALIIASAANCGWPKELVVVGVEDQRRCSDPVRRASVLTAHQSHHQHAIQSAFFEELAEVGYGPAVHRCAGQARGSRRGGDLPALALQSRHHRRTDLGRGGGGHRRTGYRQSARRHPPVLGERVRGADPPADAAHHCRPARGGDAKAGGRRHPGAHPENPTPKAAVPFRRAIKRGEWLRPLAASYRPACERDDRAAQAES
jgi:hypothetical protein